MGEFRKVGQTERRIQPRARMDLAARFMLARRRECECTVINASASGLALLGPDRGEIGDPVIVYIDHIGRIEGEIILPIEGGFAIRFRGPSRAGEALARLVKVLSFEN